MLRGTEKSLYNFLQQSLTLEVSQSMTQLILFRQDLLTHMAQEEDGAPRAYQVLEGSSCKGQGQLSGKHFIPTATSAVDNSSESVFLFFVLIASRH